MKLSDLKKEFRIHEFEGTYLVYDPNPGSSQRSVYKYLCSVTKIKSKFKINGTEELYDDIDDLKIGIINFIASLPYGSEYYCPMYRKGYFESAIVGDYLMDKGFKSSSCFNRFETWKHEMANVYGGKSNPVYLTFVGLDYFGEISEEVNISLELSDSSWISQKCKREVGEIIKTIDAILKPLFIGNSINNFNKSKEFNFENFLGDLKTAKMFEIETKEYKEQLKANLKELLLTLD